MHNVAVLIGAVLLLLGPNTFAGQRPKAAVFMASLGCQGLSQPNPGREETPYAIRVRKTAEALELEIDWSGGPSPLCEQGADPRISSILEKIVGMQVAEATGDNETAAFLRSGATAELQGFSAEYLGSTGSKEDYLEEAKNGASGIRAALDLSMSALSEDVLNKMANDYGRGADQVISDTKTDLNGDSRPSLDKMNELTRLAKDLELLGEEGRAKQLIDLLKEYSKKAFAAEIEDLPCVEEPADLTLLAYLLHQAELFSNSDSDMNRLRQQFAQKVEEYIRTQAQGADLGKRLKLAKAAELQNLSGLSEALFYGKPITPPKCRRVDQWVGTIMISGTVQSADPTPGNESTAKGSYSIKLDLATRKATVKSRIRTHRVETRTAFLDCQTGQKPEIRKIRVEVEEVTEVNATVDGSAHVLEHEESDGSMVLEGQGAVSGAKGKTNGTWTKSAKETCDGSDPLGGNFTYDYTGPAEPFEFSSKIEKNTTFISGAKHIEYPAGSGSKDLSWYLTRSNQQ